MGVHLYFTDTLIALTLGKRCYSKYYCMEINNAFLSNDGLKELQNRCSTFNINYHLYLECLLNIAIVHSCSSHR